MGRRGCRQDRLSQSAERSPETVRRPRAPKRRDSSPSTARRFNNPYIAAELWLRRRGDPAARHPRPHWSGASEISCPASAIRLCRRRSTATSRFEATAAGSLDSDRRLDHTDRQSARPPGRVTAGREEDRCARKIASSGAGANGKAAIRPALIRQPTAKTATVRSMWFRSIPAAVRADPSGPTVLSKPSSPPMIAEMLPRRTQARRRAARGLQPGIKAAASISKIPARSAGRTESAVSRRKTVLPKSLWPAVSSFTTAPRP